MVFLNTDGGSRGNPGKAACAFVVKNLKNEVIYSGGKYLGETTNNVAEYSALLLGLTTLLEKEEKSVTCRLDSELVVKQVNGQYKVKDANLKTFHTKVLDLKKQFSEIKFEYVPRAQNKEADRIVNDVLDLN